MGLLELYTGTNSSQKGENMYAEIYLGIEFAK